MDLSSVRARYNLPLSKAEAGLVKSPGSGGSRKTDAYYAEQLKRLADAREVLKQLPDRKTSERQAASEKANMLKQRLKMIKQMLPFMSAAAAKALKAELQQIASQLASLGEAGGGSAALTAGTAEKADLQAMTADAAAAEEGSTTGEDDAESAPARQEQTAGTSAKGAADTDQDKEQAAKTKAGNDQERALQDMIEELRRLYKTVRNMVQRKLQQAGDKGEPTPDLPPQLHAYRTLPESGGVLNVTR